MARFTGFMCDVCKKAETGHERPDDWIVVKLPGMGEDASKDICGDKCLLAFARARGGASRSSSKASTALIEFLKAEGVTSHARGAAIGNHVRRRHEMNGAVDDCLVCQFYATGGEG